MTMNPLESMGAWSPGNEAPLFTPDGIATAVLRFREPTHVIRDNHSGAMGVAFGGQPAGGNGAFGWIGRLPAVFPEWLGDRAFCETHRLRFPYVAYHVGGLAKAKHRGRNAVRREEGRLVSRAPAAH